LFGNRYSVTLQSTVTNNQYVFQTAQFIAYVVLYFRLQDACISVHGCRIAEMTLTRIASSI